MNALCSKIIFSEQKALASYGTQCIEFAISILGEKGLSSFLCAASPWAPVYKCPSGTWQLVLCLNNFPKMVKNNNCITVTTSKTEIIYRIFEGLPRINGKSKFTWSKTKLENSFLRNHCNRKN